MGYIFGQLTGTTSGGGGTPALPLNSVQFNNAGAFGGSANLEWDNVAQTLTITGSAAALTQLNLIGNGAGSSGLTLTDTAGGQAWDVLASSAFLIYTSVAGTPTDLGFQISQNGAGLVTASQLVAQGKTLGVTGAGAIDLNSSNGTTGQTIVSAGAGAATWGSPAAVLGARLAYASPAGGAVAANPVGFSALTGRLIVTLAAGNATWASLTAGSDGQLVLIVNADAANTLILPAAVFLGLGDLNIPPGNRALIYYDSTDASWEQT
jgi:hypothetical protein